MWTKRAGGAAPVRKADRSGELGGVIAGRGLTVVTNRVTEYWTGFPPVNRNGRGPACHPTAAAPEISADFGCDGEFFLPSAEDSGTLRRMHTRSGGCAPQGRGFPQSPPPRVRTQPGEGRPAVAPGRAARLFFVRLALPSPHDAASVRFTENPLPEQAQGFRERFAVVGCRSNAGHASCCPHAAVSDSQWLRPSGPGELRQGVPRTGHRTLHLGSARAEEPAPLEGFLGVGSAGGNAHDEAFAG